MLAHSTRRPFTDVCQTVSCWALVFSILFPSTIKVLASSSPPPSTLISPSLHLTSPPPPPQVSHVQSTSPITALLAVCPHHHYSSSSSSSTLTSQKMMAYQHHLPSSASPSYHRSSSHLREQHHCHQGHDHHHQHQRVQFDLTVHLGSAPALLSLSLTGGGSATNSNHSCSTVKNNHSRCCHGSSSKSCQSGGCCLCGSDRPLCAGINNKHKKTPPTQANENDDNHDSTGGGRGCRNLQRSRCSSLKAKTNRVEHPRLVNTAITKNKPKSVLAWSPTTLSNTDSNRNDNAQTLHHDHDGPGSLIPEVVGHVDCNDDVADDDQDDDNEDCDAGSEEEEKEEEDDNKEEGDKEDEETTTMTDIIGSIIRLPATVNHGGSVPSVSVEEEKARKVSMGAAMVGDEKTEHYQPQQQPEFGVNAQQQHQQQGTKVMSSDSSPLPVTSSSSSPSPSSGVKHHRDENNRSWIGLVSCDTLGQWDSILGSIAMNEDRHQQKDDLKAVIVYGNNKNSDNKHDCVPSRSFSLWMVDSQTPVFDLKDSMTDSEKQLIDLLVKGGGEEWLEHAVISYQTTSIVVPETLAAMDEVKTEKETSPTTNTLTTRNTLLSSIKSRMKVAKRALIDLRQDFEQHFKPLESMEATSTVAITGTAATAPSLVPVVAPETAKISGFVSSSSSAAAKVVLHDQSMEEITNEKETAQVISDTSELSEIIQVHVHQQQQPQQNQQQDQKEQKNHDMVPEIPITAPPPTPERTREHHGPEWIHNLRTSRLVSETNTIIHGTNMTSKIAMVVMSTICGVGVGIFGALLFVVALKVRVFQSRRNPSQSGNNGRGGNSNGFFFSSSNNFMTGPNHNLTMTGGQPMVRESNYMTLSSKKVIPRGILESYGVQTVLYTSLTTTTTTDIVRSDPPPELVMYKKSGGNTSLAYAEDLIEMEEGLEDALDRENARRQRLLLRNNGGSTTINLHHGHGLSLGSAGAAMAAAADALVGSSSASTAMNAGTTGLSSTGGDEEEGDMPALVPTEGVIIPGSDSVISDMDRITAAIMTATRRGSYRRISYSRQGQSGGFLGPVPPTPLPGTGNRPTASSIAGSSSSSSSSLSGTVVPTASSTAISFSSASSSSSSSFLDHYQNHNHHHQHPFDTSSSSTSSSSSSRCCLTSSSSSHHQHHQIPFANANAQTMCAICLSDYEVGEQVRTLPCYHQFHVTCIDPWLLQVASLCPICKRDLWPESS